MDLNTVKDILQPYLDEQELSLYEVELVKEFGYLILRVSIDKKGGIDVDALASCNEYLSEKLEAIDADMPEYMLEVCSPGAEKKLRSLEEAKENISKYVHIEVPNMIYEGYLEAVEGDVLHVRYNAKGRFRVLKIAFSEIDFIRLAVKI